MVKLPVSVNSLIDERFSYSPAVTKFVHHMHEAYQKSLLRFFTEKSTDNADLILLEWSQAIQKFEQERCSENDGKENDVKIGKKRKIDDQDQIIVKEKENLDIGPPNPLIKSILAERDPEELQETSTSEESFNDTENLTENQLDLKNLFLQITERGTTSAINKSSVLPSSINNSTSNSSTTLSSPINNVNNLHKTSTIAKMTQHLENNKSSHNSNAAASLQNIITDNNTNATTILPQDLANLVSFHFSQNKTTATVPHNLTHQILQQYNNQSSSSPSSSTSSQKSKCPICGKLVMQLPAHMQCHSNERKYSCPKCPSKFKRMQTLKQHLPVHLDKPQFQCDICGNTFRQAPNFYRNT